MGRPKESLQCGPEYLLQRVVRVVSEVVDPVVVAARRGQDLPSLPDHVRVVLDAIDNAGPLAGIAAGFDALAGRCDAAFVAACDQPLLKPVFITRLIGLLGDHNAVVPIHEGRLHPMSAVYRLTMRSILADVLQARVRRATTFAERCSPKAVRETDFADCDPQLESLCNFNDWQGYTALLERIERMRAGSWRGEH